MKALGTSEREATAERTEVERLRVEIERLRLAAASKTAEREELARLREVAATKTAERGELERLKVIAATKTAERAELEKLKVIAASKTAEREELERLKVIAATKTVERAELEKLRKANENRKVRISEMVTVLEETSKTLPPKLAKLRADLGGFGNHLDIAFCIDGTGSMCGHINAVRLCIVDVCNSLSTKTSMDLRTALVVYRDIHDGSLRHEVQDFCDPTTMQTKLAQVTATGGDDGPEDCFGGLMKVTNSLTWRAPRRVCLWLGDCPQHGTMYNDMRDDFPAGDPSGLTDEDVLTAFVRVSVQLIFLRITDYTDKMIATLKTTALKLNTELIQYDISADMSSLLTKSIIATASRTKVTGKSKASRKPRMMKPYLIDAACHNWDLSGPNWGPREEGTMTELTTFTGSDVHPLLDLVLDGPSCKTHSVSLTLTKQPYAEGEFRIAYLCSLKGYVPLLDKKLVAKESRYLDSILNSSKQHYDAAQIQLVAGFLAKEWTKKVREVPIRYVIVQVLKCNGREKDRNHFSVEEYIEGNYVKFNNNNGYVDRELESEHPAPQAFSHWTFQYTAGLVMVTDIQGVCSRGKYTLTDPAIHTSKDTILPDPANCGPKGMTAFFATHTCNSLCSRLGLTKPTSGRIPTVEGGFFS